MKTELIVKLIELLSSEGQEITPAPEEFPWEVGYKYFVRTVTMNYTGDLVSVGDKEIVLQDAAWIADSGRFANALETGELEEVEPFPDGEVIVGRAAIIDASIWDHDLPRPIK